MNNQHMKIQMHKRLEKSTIVCLSVDRNYGQPTNTDLYKIVAEKKNSLTTCESRDEPKCYHESHKLWSN